LIQRELTDDLVISVDFNAWNSHTPKGIIKDFFETVQEAIRPYHSSLARQFLRYSNKIWEINHTGINHFLQTIISILFGSSSLEQLHKNIEKSIKEFDKKLVIYIDDLDRLDSDEILEVIRLIRDTANFPNTVFIVAYDRDYIVSALESMNSHNKEEFLEKIFQIEISLPYFESIALVEDFRSKLEKKLPNDIFHQIQYEIEETGFSKPQYLYDWMENIRDVNRLVNSIILNFLPLKNQVVISDFLRIEILRLKYPSVHYLISKKTNDFLILRVAHSMVKHTYQLKLINENENLHHHNKSRSFLEEYLWMNLSMNENEILKVIKLLTEIFGKRTYNFKSRSHLSIVFPNNYGRYFKYGLLKNDLSEPEFLSAISSEIDELYKYIDKKIEEDLAYRLENRLLEITTFTGRFQFEKIVKAIFYLGQQWETSLRNEVYNNLISLLGTHDLGITKKIYTGAEGEKQYKQFVLSLFNNAVSPFLFEAEFIEFCNERNESPLHLDKIALRDISLRYL